jgi:hypothetical protein
MADADSAKIVSPPSMPPAPYDATSDAPVGPWVKVKSGPADAQGNVSGDWPDSGPWRQT